MMQASQLPGDQQQPTLKSVPARKKGPPTSLRIDTPAQNPNIALAIGENPSALSSATSVDSDFSLFHNPVPKARSLRNMKKLSLTLPSAQSSSNSLQLPSAEPKSAVSEIPPVLPAPRPRRPSVISLPSTANSTAVNALGNLHRKEEDGSPTVPYADGPIQIIPGIWLGSEDNARDWKCLIERGIKSILNVAKEVASPFEQPIRSFASTPNLKATDGRPQYYPSHPASGRPAMHYLKMTWSHGQQDLVDHGFPAAIKFTDAALNRGEGVLVHCQCGISRSATMVIALVMRAAAESSASVPPEVWALKGMQGAYDFVKEKSRWVGPNMSLIYQLLEYERRLKGSSASPSGSSHSSNVAEEEEEWGRRRRMLDEAGSDSETTPDHHRESDEVMREAQALDKAMEDRVIARQTSLSSINSTGTGLGVGMGSVWRSRYGASSRKRAGSVASNFTSNSGSVFSEDLVEEDEEQELLGVGGGFESTEDSEGGRQRSVSGELGEQSSVNSSPLDLTTPDQNAQYSSSTDLHNRPPPSAPVWKTAFSLPPPPLSAMRQTFDIPKTPRHWNKSSYASQQGSDAQITPKPTKARRRPPPLGVLPPVPPSPIAIVTEEEVAQPTAPRVAITLASPPPVPQPQPEAQPAARARKRTESRKPAPPPLHLRTTRKSHTSSISISSSSTGASYSTSSSRSASPSRMSSSRRSSSSSHQHHPPPTATQTLFVFPPSPTISNTRTPSTMTLMSGAGGVPFPSMMMSNTPRVSTFRAKDGRRRSFIGLGVGVPPTPTTATSRVDVTGWVGVDPA